MARVTVKEAAERLGVSVDTVRRRMRRGELVAVQEETAAGFRWMVELPEEAAGGTAREPTADATRLEDELRHEREVRAILERELESRRREVSELHVLLERAQRILPATTASQEAETVTMATQTGPPPSAAPSPTVTSARSLTWRERLLGRTRR